jgi:hypothetical protein
MYDYKKERPWVFTEDGVRKLFEVYDIAVRAIEQTGAVSTSRLMRVSGDSFQTMACIDFLEEIGRIRCCAKAGIRNEWVYY